MSGQATYTTRQAACDLRKLRGKALAVKPARSRRYQIPPQAARAITAMLVLRDQVIAPLLAGLRVRRRDRIPTTWAPVDRDYEALRIDMNTLFRDLGIQATAA